MAKKRPTLDAFLNTQTSAETKPEPVAERVAPAKTGAKTAAPKAEKTVAAENAPSASGKGKKTEIIRHMLYLPLPVYDQLQELIFAEQRGQTKRRKTHDYLLDAIDLLFKKKGLKSIAELTKEQE